MNPLQDINKTPRHVDLARQLLSDILYRHGITTYKHTNGPVIWASDTSIYFY
jgi:hypothetical protein